jgi:hypothetical protein
MLPTKTWPILKIFFSETAWPNESKLEVLIHLAKRFQRRRFLEINQSETRIGCGAIFVCGS